MIWIIFLALGAKAEVLSGPVLDDLNAYQPVRMCYNNLIRRHPKSTEGKVTMSMRLGKTGEVVAARPIPEQTTYQDKKFLSCLSDALQILRFSKMANADQKTLEASLYFP